MKLVQLDNSKGGKTFVNPAHVIRLVENGDKVTPKTDVFLSSPSASVTAIGDIDDIDDIAKKIDAGLV